VGVTPRPSIRDVARIAGVSPGLASLALNDRPGVAAATRARIREVADSLGYRADPHARALRTGATSTAGLIIRNLQNPYFLDVITAAQQAAAQEGTTLLVVDSDYSVRRELEHIEQLAAARVDALAIAPVGPGGSIERWQELAEGRPTVVLNADVPGSSGVTRVSPDNRAAVRLAATHLAELGHRRITFLTAPADLMADHDRLDAFVEVCAELDVTPDPVETPLNMTAVREVTERLLAGRSRPTAVVTNSDFTAHAVYSTARACGVAVGRQLSVVGHDDLPTSELLDPPLTTLALDRRALGRALAARLLRAADRGGDTGLGDHVEPVHLVVRGSTGPPPRRR
jgi:LacI family transcriptional regulator